MISGLRRTALRSFSIGILVVFVIFLIGCATTGASNDSGEALAGVIGTWTYEASGSQPLSRGTFQLATTNGRLTGQLRDSELGAIPLDANVSGKRLELRIDVFRIGALSVAGSVQGDEFRGLVDRPAYNVAMSANEAPELQRDLHGSFRAERRGAPASPKLVLGCPKLGPDGIQSCQ